MSQTFASNTTNLEDNTYRVEDKTVGERVGKKF